MDQEKLETADDACRWWLSTAGKAEGPYTESYIRAGLKTNTIASNVYSCPVGGQEWKAVSEWPEFAGACSANTPPPPPDHTRPTKPSWNPLALASLGLLFTPAWTGIMAALNARRLGLSLPAWRPLAIGIGSTVLYILLSCAGMDRGFIIETLIFEIVPLVAIWHLDLAAQEQPHAAKQLKTQDHWIGPVLAGSPFGLLTIVSLWLVLFGPLEPLEVVKRFDAANTVEEARKYITSNLYQMVDDFQEAERLAPELLSDDDGEVEYLGEYYDENDDNQYYVDYRLYVPPIDSEPGGRMEGYYHLRWLDGSWKIDDILVTSLNGQQPDAGAVSLSIFAREFVKEARRMASTRPPPKAEWSLRKFWDGLPTLTKHSIRMMITLAMLAAAGRGLSKIKE